MLWTWGLAWWFVVGIWLYGCRARPFIHLFTLGALLRFSVLCAGH